MGNGILERFVSYQLESNDLDICHLLLSYQNEVSLLTHCCHCKNYLLPITHIQGHLIHLCKAHARCATVGRFGQFVQGLQVVSQQITFFFCRSLSLISTGKEKKKTYFSSCFNGQQVLPRVSLLSQFSFWMFQNESPDCPIKDIDIVIYFTQTHQVDHKYIYNYFISSKKLRRRTRSRMSVFWLLIILVIVILQFYIL